MPIRISTRSAIVATLCCATTAAIVRSNAVLTVYTIVMILLLLWTQRGSERPLGVTLIKWTIPFVLPLILMHGILNAGFPADYWAGGIIPIRLGGLAFGYSIATKIVILSVVGGFWISVSQDDLVESMIRLGLPSWLLLFLMQSAAMSGVIRRRITNVYLAQRARGIPVSGGFGERARAFPSVLLPVILGTFVEADARIPGLVSRGFGSINPTHLPRPRFSNVEFVLIALCITLATASVFAGVLL